MISSLVEKISSNAIDYEFWEDLVTTNIGLRRGNTAWKINRDVAFVHAPQSFHNVDSNGYMAHENGIVCDDIGSGH